MKNIAFTLLFLYLSASSAFTQRVIRLEYKQDMQGNFVFSCTNNAWCNYILGFDFTSLENAKADHALPWLSTVKPGVNKLFKLTKDGAGKEPQFKYKLTYFKGCLDPQINTDFTYLLPISPGKEAQAYELQTNSQPIDPSEFTTPAPSPAKSTPSRPSAPIHKPAAPSAKSAASQSAASAPGTAAPVAIDLRTAYAIRLRMKPGDTLFAARRGTVTELDVSDSLNDAGQSNTGTGNYIEIVHADCSFARYGVLKRNGALVRPGQFVEAGDPIGIIGGDKFGRGSEVRISVCYNRKPDLAHNDPGNEDRSYWAYVPLKFWTKKNGKGMLRHGASYISEFPETVITQEMSKTELAKRKARQQPAKSPKSTKTH